MASAHASRQPRPLNRSAVRVHVGAAQAAHAPQLNSEVTSGLGQRPIGVVVRVRDASRNGEDGLVATPLLPPGADEGVKLALGGVALLREELGGTPRDLKGSATEVSSIHERLHDLRQPAGAFLALYPRPPCVREDQRPVNEESLVLIIVREIVPAARTNENETTVGDLEHKSSRETRQDQGHRSSLECKAATYRTHRWPRFVRHTEPEARRGTPLAGDEARRSRNGSGVPALRDLQHGGPQGGRGQALSAARRRG